MANEGRTIGKTELENFVAAIFATAGVALGHGGGLGAHGRVGRSARR